MFKGCDPWRAVEQELDHIATAARPFTAEQFLDATTPWLPEAYATREDERLGTMPYETWALIQLAKPLPLPERKVLANEASFVLSVVRRARRALARGAYAQATCMSMVAAAAMAQLSVWGLVYQEQQRRARAQAQGQRPGPQPQKRERATSGVRRVRPSSTSPAVEGQAVG